MQAQPPIGAAFIRFWLKSALWLRLLIVFIAALLAGVLLMVSGRLDDCSPHHKTAHCGMSTFLGVVVGFLAFCSILVSGWLATFVQWFRAKKIQASKTQIE